MEEHLNGNSGFRHEWLIAIAMSLALFVWVAGFVYLTLTSEHGVFYESHGFASGPLGAALFLFILAESDLPAKIRMSVPVRRQIAVWTAWLAILGIAPALDPQWVPQSKIWLIGGPLLLVASIKALLFPTSTR